MNPWDLTASELMIWGLVLHLIADWLLQNEWMAVNKMQRATSLRLYRSGMQEVPLNWYRRHPAAYVHSGIHLVFLFWVFGFVAIPLAMAHFFIDLRFPVAWWSRFVGQTQPKEGFDIGADVRIWTDQVFHIVCIAIAALIVGSV